MGNIQEVDIIRPESSGALTIPGHVFVIKFQP